MATKHVDPHELHNRLVEAGEDWADKQAAADLLEETKKTVLGEVTTSNMIWADSHAQAEKSAFSSDQYKDHIKKMVEARRLANRARIRYDAAKTFIELLRSEVATRRVEMQHQGIVP